MDIDLPKIHLLDNPLFILSNIFSITIELKWCYFVYNAWIPTDFFFILSYTIIINIKYNSKKNERHL